MKQNRKTKYTEEIIKKTYISLLLANPEQRVTVEPFTCTTRTFSPFSKSWSRKPCKNCFYCVRTTRF